MTQSRHGTRSGVGDRDKSEVASVEKPSRRKSSKELVTAKTANPREEQIRKRAYELYLARKGGPGSDVQDWLQAEAEIIWKLDH